jgi:hypothetical protein
VNNKARVGKNNGRWKGVPPEAESFFISGYLSGLSTRTLSIRWRMVHNEHIDHRRIARWIKQVEALTLSSSDSP